MSQSNVTEIKEQEETGSIVQQFIYRLSKKNHDAMVELEKQFMDIFKKHGRLRTEYFQLNSNENMMKDRTTGKIVLAGQHEEEVWVEQIFYKDSKHWNEYMAKYGNDENMNRRCKQFMDLITPRFSPILGEFSRLEV
jgi:tetrahydrodipicolinate N-succinyltransferase